MKNFLFLSLGILVFASACDQFGVRGSGNVTPETRSVSGFRNVSVGGAIDVFIKQDSASSVKVEADDNLLQYIEVSTEGPTLRIRTRSGVNLRPTQKIKVFISNPVFEELSVSGASALIGENSISSGERITLHVSGASEGRLDINAPRIIVEVSGASSANLRGRTKDLEANAAGASRIRGFDLLSENTNVDVSGASHADVYASVSLDGEASGASGVTYMGLGDKGHSIHTSGASHVGKKD